eukprot:3077653-Pyramimonas_sp.AAC.1
MCRTLIQNGAASEPFQTSRSVVQGLRAGTSFARTMTYFAMKQVTTASPRMGHKLWIGDISQKAVGSRA